MNGRLQHEQKAITRKSRWRLAGLIAGGILSAIALVFLAILFLALRVPPAPEVQVNALSVQRLDEAFRQAGATAQAGTPSNVQADETQVNSKLQELLRSYRNGPQKRSPDALKDVRIKLQGDRIAAYVLLKHNGRELAFQLAGKIHTENGNVLFEPESGAIGVLPIPRSRIQAAATQLADAPGSPLKYRLPSNISDIHVEDGKLVFIVK